MPHPHFEDNTEVFLSRNILAVCQNFDIAPVFDMFSSWHHHQLLQLDRLSAVDIVVPANVKVIVPMDIAGMIIDGTYGRLPRYFSAKAKSTHAEGYNAFNFPLSTGVVLYMNQPA